MKKLIIGNLKMQQESVSMMKTYAEELIAALPSTPHAEVVVAPQEVQIMLLQHLCAQTEIGIGAQNCHQDLRGAFTGDTSAYTLKSAGVEYVIVGHSERRRAYGEDDALVAAKTKTALAAGLSVTVCVGSVGAVAADDQAIRASIEKVCAQIAEADLPRISFAYEPLAAIGSGVAESPQDVFSMMLWMRKTLERQWGQAHRRVRCLYGGSVAPENAATLMHDGGADGLLVGTAALTPAAFAEIVAAAA